MHEASIALGLLDIAEMECTKAGLKIVQSVHVNIGRASGVMPDALQTAFDIAKLETPLRTARLIINVIPLGGRCNSCGVEFSTEEQFLLECPSCCSADFMFYKGRELDIIEIEAD